MTKIILIIVIGYLLGSLSPAAFVSRVKNKNLRNHGTGNLGATNTMLVFGKWYGILVMFFDIAKAFFAVKLSAFLFPDIRLAGLIAGFSAVVGHIFPFYLKFKGGKGLAAMGGLVLAYDSVSFVILLAVGIALMLIVNYGVALPVSAAVLFPFLSWLRSDDITVLAITAILSALVIFKHFPNIRRAICGNDIRIREYLKKL